MQIQFVIQIWGGAILKQAVVTVENVDTSFFFDAETDINLFKDLLLKLKSKMYWRN